MNTKPKSTYIKIISVLSFLTIALTIMTVRYALKANRYRIEAEIVSQRAMNELCESLDNITVSLEKSLYASTPNAMTKLGNDLTRQASTAKMSLSELTDKDMITDEMYKFLSQIGEYTLSLCQGDAISTKKEDTQALKKLYTYSKSLSESFDSIRRDYFDGIVTLEQVKSDLMEKSEVPDTLLSKMQDAEQSLTNYPTLIYDGPFADNILNAKGGESLKNEREITKAQAKEIAADILGQKSESLKNESDEEGDISLYCFSFGDSSVGITKKGGRLYYLLSPYSAGEETISEKEAVKRGSEYLKKYGYDSMKETYYYVFDGVCTINFAYVKEGITHYSDLIKVSVALDTGKTVAVDASVYLKNHKERSFSEAKISEKKAKNLLSPSLQVTETKKALIPLDTGKEALCYELHCVAEDKKELLIYVDCQSGEEQEILLLLYSDNGVLVK